MFEDVVRGSAEKTFDRGFLADRSGNKNEWSIGTQSPGKFQCNPAIEPRKAQIADDQIELCALQPGGEIGSGLHAHNVALYSRILQGGYEQFRIQRIVFD